MNAQDKYIGILTEALQLAKDRDWQAVYRAILGRDGKISELTPQEKDEFMRSEQHQAILRCLAQLRERSPRERSPLIITAPEPTRVITVRLPESLHEALHAEAHDYRTSVNKLCVSKLLQFIESDFVPEDRIKANHQ